MSDHPKTFEIIYNKVNNKPTIAVMGAVGGNRHGQGSVVAHLSTEYFPPPEYEIHDVGEEGKVTPGIGGEKITRGNLTREIQATLVMSPLVAKALGTWLVEHAKLALGE